MSPLHLKACLIAVSCWNNLELSTRPAKPHSVGLYSLEERSSKSINARTHGGPRFALLHRKHPPSDLQFIFHPVLSTNSVLLTHCRDQLECSRMSPILFPQNWDSTLKGRKKKKSSFLYDTGGMNQFYIYFYSARSLFPAKMILFHLWKLSFPQNKTSCYCSYSRAKFCLFFFCLNSNNKIFPRSLKCPSLCVLHQVFLSLTSTWLFHLYFHSGKSRTVHFHRKTGTACGVVSPEPFFHYWVHSSCNTHLACQWADRYKCMFTVTYPRYATPAGQAQLMLTLHLCLPPVPIFPNAAAESRPDRAFPGKIIISHTRVTFLHASGKSVPKQGTFLFLATGRGAQTGEDFRTFPTT